MATTDVVLAARAKWRYRGESRPPFAIEPGSGQESVWDYPRPPRIEADPRPVRVTHGDLVLAESTAAVRVLETSSPPTFYVPPRDVNIGLLKRSQRQTFCGWKGTAHEFDLTDVQGVAWAYLDTYPEFASIIGWFSFYPAKVQCTVGSETVRPQQGGGWITSELVGPFKGDPGSKSWW